MPQYMTTSATHVACSTIFFTNNAIRHDQLRDTLLAKKKKETKGRNNIAETKFKIIREDKDRMKKVQPKSALPNRRRVPQRAVFLRIYLPLSSFSF
jgi:hypothetical protein